MTESRKVPPYDGAADRGPSSGEPEPGEFDDLLPVSLDALAALSERLVRRADAAGLLDIAYRTVDSPLGTLLLVASERGLVRVAYECEGFDAVLQTVAQRISPRILKAPGRLDGTVSQFDDYFNGRRRTFDLSLDDRLSAGFRQIVQRYLPQIGYGTTATYKQVAEQVGHPQAVRAVGSACATNPLPVVVPCHRVLRSDGSAGGYIGGLEAKRWLLALEKQCG